MTEEKKIFLVDDNEANLIACKNILKPYYTVFPISSAAKMLDLMEHVTPDLILLDIEMPDMDGFKTAQILKNNELYSEIPLIFISGHYDPADITKGLNSGAMDFIQKPVISALLLKRIEIILSVVEYKKLLRQDKNK